MKRSPVFAVLAFIVSGVVSGVLTRVLPEMQIAPGIPFALLCAALCVRGALAAALVAALQCLVWVGALNLSILLHDAMGGWAALAGGVTGALGVTAATAAGAAALRRWGVIAVGTLCGLSALPFCYFVEHDSAAGLCFSFAVWQAVVGTYLYTTTTSSS